jgi:EXLDI family protein
VVHAQRSERLTSGPDAEKWSTGWRALVGNWSSNQTWSVRPAEPMRHVVDSLEELRDLLPPELYDLVAEAAEHPNIEDLDI